MTSYIKQIPQHTITKIIYFAWALLKFDQLLLQKGSTVGFGNLVKGLANISSIHITMSVFVPVPIKFFSLEPLDCIDVFMRESKCCDGVSLDKGSQGFLRELIKTQEANYIDLRNYLFSRQCNLLLKLNRPSPWEVAQRTLDFLHNLIHELAMDTLKVCTD